MKRVTLPAKSTSASIYITKKLSPLYKPEVLKHALIEVYQAGQALSVYMEKSWPI